MLECVQLAYVNFFMMIVVSVLLVFVLRIMLLKRREEIELKKQVIILIELTKQVVKDNTSVHKGTRNIVGTLPQKIATVVEKVVLDNEARRSDSDLPRGRPLSQEGKDHE